MFKSLIAILGIRDGIGFIKDINNHMESKVKLSDKRKMLIEERRANLKVEDNYSEALKIVIEEMLAYKPVFFTIDDRYLQLEQILDAIDKAKITKEPNDLITKCRTIAEDIASSPGRFTNTLLRQLVIANSRINALNGNISRAKL